ncbi:hypothetical protein QQ045_019099 [Rhodiola kirilowii]
MNGRDSILNMMDRGHFLGNSSQIQTEEEEYRKWGAVCNVIYSAHVTSLVSLLFRFNVGQFVSKDGDYQRQILMGRLTMMEDEDCRNQLRMGKDAFCRLVHILRETGRLKDNCRSSVEEQVAKFLHIIGHNVRTRVMKFYVMRSSETPYFKDCVGSIDGSHFRVKVSNEVVHRYRGRKSYPTQNVLAACDFNLRFTYVMPGWEGSASDSRILDNALQRNMDKLIVPRGKYYLVDAGFQLRTGFLAPYRSTRYHLKEYTIPILASGSEAHYRVQTQADMVLAGCIIHNFLMGVDPNIDLIDEVDKDLMNAPAEDDDTLSLKTRCREGEILRERISFDMWKDYNINRDL